MGALAVLVVAGVGLAVGLLSGLIGIGGGVLIVPFLYFFYDHPELFGVRVAEEVRTVLAHGTSLFVIVPTSIQGIRSFQRSRLVEWRAVWPIGAASVVGAVAGAQVAERLPEEALKIGFGLLLMVAGARRAAGRERWSETDPQPEPRLVLVPMLLIGLAVGLFSAVLGVGGGIIAIPLLMHVVGLPVRKVAATSIGIIAITAAAGAVAYMWNGQGADGLPSWSLGYVHVAAGLAMLIGSAASVGWGARLNQRMRPKTLTLVFSILFFLLGARLVLENSWDLVAKGSSETADAVD